MILLQAISMWAKILCPRKSIPTKLSLSAKLLTICSSATVISPKALLEIKWTSRALNSTSKMLQRQRRVYRWWAVPSVYRTRPKKSTTPRLKISIVLQPRRYLIAPAKFPAQRWKSPNRCTRTLIWAMSEATLQSVPASYTTSRCRIEWWLIRVIGTARIILRWQVTIQCQLTTSFSVKIPKVARATWVGWASTLKWPQAHWLTCQQSSAFRGWPQASSTSSRQCPLTIMVRMETRWWT